MRTLQARLAGHGVAFGHWTFLRILWQREGLTQRELAEVAGVSEPSALAAIRAMDALGYVTRTQLPENRKNVYVGLTPKGRALRPKLEPLAIATNHLAVRGVRAADIAATRRTLLAMIDNLDSPAARKLSSRAATPRKQRD